MKNMDKEYFDIACICLSCNKNKKLENQIVCDYCHQNELKPEWIEGE